MDEITPHSHPLSLEPNGHSREYKVAIAAATSLIDLAKYLSAAASTLDKLEGVDRVAAMAEIQEKITQCSELLAGPSDSKRNDTASGERLAFIMGMSIQVSFLVVAVLTVLYFLLLRN